MVFKLLGFRVFILIFCFNRLWILDYKWVELYYCYEELLGFDIMLKDYKCYEYRGCDYNLVMKEYKFLIMNILLGV